MSDVVQIQYKSPQTPEPLDPQRPPGRFDWVWAPATFAGLTLLLFIDVLFSTTRAVAHINADLSMQFIAWREFGFSELRHGNIPLWNPHIFGGAPYFAGFQSALIYPPNWLHLILPVGMAINWISALHIFLAGYFTYFWVRGRHVSLGGSILAGIMFMFCGPYFLHLYAGHLPHIAVMVWTPLMLLTIDKLGETGNWRWCLLGNIAAAMQILAGHPQYVYFTGMILGAYLLLQLIHSQHRLAMMIGFAAMYFGAVLLSAMQLLPGVSSASEQVRSGGLPYSVASTFALPPQNFMTALAPTFFGNLPPAGETVAQGAYWGTAYLWEVSIFISITGLVLALLGLVLRFKRWDVKIAMVMLLVTIVLALGRHTPLYYPMYKLLPMYSSFRGAVKFAYLAALFMALLAGIGLDAVLAERKVSWLAIYPIAVASFVLAMLGCIIWSSANAGASGAWAQFVKDITDSGFAAQEQWFFLKQNQNELWTELSPATLTNIANAGVHAAEMTLLAAGTLLIIAALLWACRLDRRAPYLLIVLAAIELFAFARTNRPTMNPGLARLLPEPWNTALLNLPKGQRFLTTSAMLDRADVGMILGMDNVSGYDPGIQKRYAELIYRSQGLSPNDASQYLDFNQITPGVFRLLRCGLLLNAPANQPMRMVKPGTNEPIDLLPEALLISDWVRIQGRDPILDYMMSPTFDPARTVVLEQDPPITTTPAAAAPGTVTMVSRTTDTLEINAEMDRAGILLVTDNFSKGWRINPIKSGQASYSIVPADYTMIGVPLERGSHHFVLEYAPAAFTIGKRVTLLSLLGFAGTLFIAFRRNPANAV